MTYFQTALIIVTHDKGIAEQCGRIIEISDGEIKSDEMVVG